MQTLNNYKYSLSVRQQPRQARMSGFSDQYTPLTKPTFGPLSSVLQFNTVYSSKSKAECRSIHNLHSDFQYGSLICCATLCNRFCRFTTGFMDSRSDKSPYEENKAAIYARITNLMGTSVVACEYLVDDVGDNGFFFVYSDLSFRWTGRYYLRFELYDVQQYQLIYVEKCWMRNLPCMYARSAMNLKSFRRACFRGCLVSWI
jgi:Velvet factor